MISSRWFVYTVRCRDGSIYTGVTTDLPRRLEQHNAGRGGAYTRSKRPVRLIFQEIHPNRSSALKREFEIKGLPHLQKQSLSQTAKNPCDNNLKGGSIWRNRVIS